MKPNFSRERTYFSLELSLYVIPSGAKHSRGIPENTVPYGRRAIRLRST